MTFCNRDNWFLNASLPAVYGNQGDWYFVNCPNGFFINGGSVRFQDAKTGIDRIDNTVLNGLRINCKDPKTLV